jgi:hypothetical protein
VGARAAWPAAGWRARVGEHGVSCSRALHSLRPMPCFFIMR